MANKLYDLIIIGSGPAGMAAAIYAARKGLLTLIIGKEVGGQVSKTDVVENYLGFGSSTGTDLVKAFHQHSEEFENIEHLHDLSVKNIEKADKDFQVLLENGDFYKAKSLIIASGRNPRQLNVPGEMEFRNKGVSYCEVCDAPLFKGKTTAVIGGGNSALEAVLSLAKLCPTVYIININPALGGDKISQDKVKSFENVKIINNAQTLEIMGDKFVTGLKYKDLKTNKELKLDLQGVFIEIGWSPSVDFDKLTKKDKWNQIIIDKQCKTNIEGIFAAGDVTDVGFYQIIVAAGEGAKAALSAYQYLTRRK